MIDPLVTVICGYYNRPGLVKRTLDGIRSQTFSNYEVIIFDDKSTDDTPQKIKEWIAETGDNRFRLIEHERNLGFTRGLINAISNSRGKYIAIHDSGDLSFPRRFDEQVKVLERDPCVGVVGCHYVNYIEHSHLARVRRPNASGASFEDICHDSKFTHGEVMFRKSIYDKVGGYREQFKFSQDSDLWLRMILESSFFTVPEVLYVRYIQFGGISYKPETFVAQAAFYTLARVVARDKVRERELLKGLPDAHVFTALPLHDPSVQKIVVRGALRGIIFGDFDQAAIVAKGFVKSRLERIGILTMAWFGKTVWGELLLKVVRSRLGVVSMPESELVKKWDAGQV